MKYKPGLRTIDGITYQVIDSIDPDRPFMAAIDLLKQKKTFEEDGVLFQSELTASRGISAHVLSIIDTDDAQQGLPKPANESGFSAKWLQILGDEGFDTECIAVMLANDWSDWNVNLNDNILNTVIEKDGPHIIEKAKNIFGDNW